MSEFRKVTVADRSPTTCIACGTHEGPFIDLQTTIAQVPTTVGITDLDIGFYLCCGTFDRPGCVVQAGRLTGLVVDISKYDELRQELALTLAKNEQLTDLNRELAKKKTVSGETMLLALGANTGASVA